MKREDLLAPEHYNLVSEMERYAKDPGKVAVLWENETGDKKQLTYENLLKSANKIGNAFKKKGLGKGDTVLIIIPRLVEAYQVYLAALKIGMIVIPCSEMLRAKDLQYRVNHGDVKGIISYHEYTDELNEIEGAESLLKFSIGKRIENWLDLNELADEESDQLTMADTKSEDMAFLSYTSGTTGNPKGVVHTHGWAYAHLKTSAANWLGISETDVVWATAGPGWQKWIWSPFLAVLGTGATGLAYHGKFEAKKYLQLLQDYKVNALCCTPTEYRLIAKVDNLDDYDLSHLHSAVSAGEPLNQKVFEVFKNHFQIEVRDGYGQTENTLLVGVTKGMEIKLGSMGKPTPGNHVEIIDDSGKPCSPGVVGDIAVHVDTPALI